jgi:REase_DpnII-MboI
MAATFGPWSDNPQEWTPSHAGACARMDFMLKQRIVIEAKKTREKFADKEIGEELLVDIAKYKEHPDCGTLVCFIYACC